MESTKEKLLKAATTLFSRYGVDAVSVRDIVKEARASLSAVNYYFGSKEALYKACIADFGKKTLYIAQRVLKTPSTPYEFITRLEVFISETFQALMEEAEVGRIVQRECSRDSDMAEDLFSDTYLKQYEYLIEYLDQSQESGILDRKQDTEILASIIMGTITEFLRTDKYKTKSTSIETPNYREKVVSQLTQLIATAMVAKIERSEDETRQLLEDWQA